MTGPGLSPLLWAFVEYLDDIGVELLGESGPLKGIKKHGRAEM